MVHHTHQKMQSCPLGADFVVWKCVGFCIQSSKKINFTYFFMHRTFGYIPSVRCFFAFTIVDKFIRGPPLINSNFWSDRRYSVNKINSPKRRKSKDNPYIINHIENNNTYIVIFKNNNKIIICTVVLNNV